LLVPATRSELLDELELAIQGGAPSRPNRKGRWPALSNCEPRAGLLNLESTKTRRTDLERFLTQW